MLAVSEDQEKTLIRWAKVHGSRPEGSHKRFLEEEKGLSADQIDNWWNEMEWFFKPLNGSVDAPWAGPGAAVEVENSGWNNNAPAGSVPFGTEEGDLLPPLPLFVNQSGHLSFTSSYSNVTSPSDRSSTATSSSLFSGASGIWDHGAVRSSTATTGSLLSTSSESWDQVKFSNRSSEVSFTTASSQFAGAVPEYEGDDFPSHVGDLSSSQFAFEDYPSNQSNYAPQPGGYIDPSDLNLTLRAGSRGQWTRQHSGVPRPLFSEASAQKTSDTPMDDIATLTPPQPTKPTQPSKLTKPNPNTTKSPGNYACTTCHHPFPNKKFEWARHESSQCDPQTLWICMLGDPSILVPSTPGTFLCAFCPTTLPRAEMSKHLTSAHHIGVCASKPTSSTSRTFPGRKDKLKQHLHTVHKLSATPPLHPCPPGTGPANPAIWETWNAPPTPPKRAWGCGFCASVLYTWPGRLEHIAAHFAKDGLHISSWSADLALKGLLRQNYPGSGFDVQGPWEAALARHGFSRDARELAWEKGVAGRLGGLLAVRGGDARALAEEAVERAVVVGGKGEGAADVAAGLLSGGKAWVWPVGMVRGVGGGDREEQHRYGSSGSQYGDLRLACEVDLKDVAMGEFI